MISSGGGLSQAASFLRVFANRAYGDRQLRMGLSSRVWWGTGVNEGAQLYWLEAFAVGEAWRDGVDEETLREVIARTPPQEVEAAVHELEANDLCVDPDALTNLLRHWIRVSLSERAFLRDPEHEKKTRAEAKKLNTALIAVEALTQGPHTSGLSYPISQYLDHQYRVHRAYELFDVLGKVAAELRPAVERLAESKFSPGRKPNQALEMEIEGLADIFEYLTGRKATRTYDPQSQREAGPFYAFVERCLRLVNNGEDVPIDWPYRKVLEQRAPADRIRIEN